jgi:hypothetical protein
MIRPCSEPLFTSIEGWHKGYEIQGHIKFHASVSWFALAWLIGKGEQIGAWYIFWFSDEKYGVPW